MTGLFIDLKNIAPAMKAEGKMVDYSALVEAIEHLYGSCRARVYVIQSDKPGLRKLMLALSFMGLSVKALHESRTRHEIEMVLDILELSRNCEIVVLVSGDKCLVPMVEWLQRQGKKVVVIGSKQGSVSTELMCIADTYYNISDLEMKTGIKLLTDSSSSEFEDQEHLLKEEIDEEIQ